MRLIVPCMKCFQELGRPTEEFSSVEFCDDGRYEITCSRGHKTITILQQQKFEILFDIGAYALLDGYYREAVSSFTSSLERFYEFSIRVFLEKSTSSDILFQSCWKKVSNRSERQLGAFIFLWASFFGETPDILPEKQASFRNDVIHNGKIPTRDEAIKYGNIILEILRPKMRKLQEKLPEEIGKVISYHLRNSQSNADNGKQISTMCVSTIVSLSSGDEAHHKKTLDECLINLSKWRKIIS